MSYIAMHKNINDLVDFEKLKKCNGMCLKWAIRLNIPRKQYLNFVFRTFKNPSTWMNKIDPKYRSQFVKDCKIMFYAAEIEELLIKQYHGMVLRIMRMLRVNIEKYDDYLIAGYVGIRAAIWQYRAYKVKASFTTYAFRSIFLRIRGKLHKEKVRIPLKHKMKIYFMTDIESKDEEREIYYGYKDCARNMEDINDRIDEIIKNCSLTEQEAMLLRSYVDRRIESPSWHEDYRAKYLNTKTGKRISRQSVFNHLDAIRSKIYNYLKNNEIIPDWFVYDKMEK